MPPLSALFHLDLVISTPSTPPGHENYSGTVRDASVSTAVSQALGVGMGIDPQDSLIGAGGHFAYSCTSQARQLGSTEHGPTLEILGTTITTYLDHFSQRLDPRLAAFSPHDLCIPKPHLPLPVLCRVCSPDPASSLPKEL